MSKFETTPLKMYPFIEFIRRYIHVEQEELADMLNMLHYATFEKNTLLKHPGDIVTNIHFILKGLVRAFYIDKDGNEHTLGFISENEPMISLSGFFHNKPSMEYVITMERIDVVYVKHIDFMAFLDKHPRYEKVIREVIGHYYMLETEQSNLIRLNSARKRYEKFCELHPDWIKRIPLKYIASYLNMALETMSRIRSKKSSLAEEY